MTQATLPVRPFGIWGRTYLLPETLYSFYRVYRTIYYAILFLLATLQVVLPTLLRHSSWSVALPFLLVIASVISAAFVLLGAFGLWCIASRGTPVTLVRAPLTDTRDPTKSVLFFVFGFYKWSIYLSAGLLLFVSLTYLLLRLINNDPFDPSLFVFLFPSSAVFLVILVRRYLRYRYDRENRSR